MALVREKDTVELKKMANIVFTNSDDATAALKMISSGPAALAQHMIYEIMAMYAEIIKMSKEQKVNMLKAQTKQVETEARATESGALSMGIAMGVAGGLSLIGAAATIKTSGIDKEQYKTNQVEMKGIEGKMGKLNKVDTLVTEGPEAPKGQGGVSDDIKERMKEFKEMNFSNLDVKNGKPDAISQKAIAQIKTEGNINPEHEGYDPEKAQDFEDFKEEYVERMNKHSTDRNSIAHKQTAIMTRRDLYGRIISPSVSGLSTAAQGIGQADKGAKDATAALNRTAGQMSGSNSQESGQQMSKAYDSLVQEISQVLEGIKQSGVVR